MQIPIATEFDHACGQVKLSALTTICKNIWTVVVCQKNYPRPIQARIFDLFPAWTVFIWVRRPIGFASLHDWLKKKLAPLFHPIRSKTKNNGNSLGHVFARFVSASRIYFKSWLVHCIVCFLCDWLEIILRFWFHSTQYGVFTVLQIGVPLGSKNFFLKYCYGAESVTGINPFTIGGKYNSSLRNLSYSLFRNKISLFHD